MTVPVVFPCSSQMHKDAWCSRLVQLYSDRVVLLPLHPDAGLLCQRRCTHLTLDAVLEREKVADLQQAGVRSIAQALLAGPTGAFWSERTFTVTAAPLSARLLNSLLSSLLKSPL